MQPGRGFRNGSGYRYGFNGKENDNEVKGEGNQQDYGMRIYDPRLGKFLSLDPLQKDYPELTPYQFSSNTPIQAIDIDGLEKFYYARTTDNKGNTVLTPLKTEPLIESKQVLIGYTTPQSAMADPQPIYKTVQEVNQDQVYIVYSPIERPIARAGNVTWETYQGIATFDSYEAAANSKTEDFKMQAGDLVLHYAVQGLINVGEEYKEGNAQSMNKLSTGSSSSATANQTARANGNTDATDGALVVNSSIKKTNRSGDQTKLREIATNSNSSSADRGWIKQEINQIARGKRTTIRRPPGRVLAHERGREAAKGYSYKHSKLQTTELHKLQHKYDNNGTLNKERSTTE